MDITTFWVRDEGGVALQEEPCNNSELQLQRITAEHLKYLSEWWDRERILDKLKLAIAVSVNATERQVELWREGIKSIQNAIRKKLDYMSFMLVKDAEKYLDPKSFNMEYGVADDEEEDITITLCLWANLYTAVRKQGMSMLGFSFKLPVDIVQENCAVRLMHTVFDHVSPQKIVIKGISRKETEDIQSSHPIDLDGVCEGRNGMVDGTENPMQFTEDTELGDTEQEKDNREQQDDSEQKMPDDDQKASTDVKQEKDAAIPHTETQIEVEEKLSSDDFSVFDPRHLPPLIEPEICIVDPEEYFVVGGIFYFDLYLVPKLTVRSGTFTYIHRENPKFRRIRYKRLIVPPRTLDGDTSYSAATYEKLRYHKELEGAIFVQLQLPKRVIFMSTPEPARLFTDKKGYSKDCVYEPSYDARTRQISFKTNQFGIFGMLQKKYANFPYKKWALKAGKSVVLTIVGKVLEIEIEVTDEGYVVTFLHPDDEFCIERVNSRWMAADLLIENLRTVGINIELGYDAHKFVDICRKETSLENNVYDCISLLSGQYDFRSVKESTSESDLIKIEFSDKKEKTPQTVVIRKDEVVDLETERKRIELEKAAVEDNESDGEDGTLDDPKTQKDLEAAETPTKEITDESIENKPGTASQETFKEPIFKDLYNYVMNEIDENQKDEIMSTNACLIENVRRLLRICKPLSSM